MRRLYHELLKIPMMEKLALVSHEIDIVGKLRKPIVHFIKLMPFFWY